MHLITERERERNQAASVLRLSTGEMIEGKRKTLKHNWTRNVFWRPSELFGGIPIII